MFKLMDRVDDGVLPMLHDLQHHIKEAGLSDMHACANLITTVCASLCINFNINLLAYFLPNSVQYL